MFAANTPHIATDTTLLAPLITDVRELPHLGQYMRVSIGFPQLGQFFALSETSFLHSGHLIIAIVKTSNNKLTKHIIAHAFTLVNNYFTDSVI